MLSIILIFLMLGLAVSAIMVGSKRYVTELLTMWFLIAALTMAVVFH